MKKMTHLVSIISLMLAINAPATALAANSNNYSTNTGSSINQTINQSTIDYLSTFVRLNSSSHNYEIIPEARLSLSKEDYQFLSRRIEQTNQMINSADFSTGQANVIAPQEERSTNTYSLMSVTSEGVDKIDFYWWGARVYLSKSTVRTMGATISIAGVIIPEAVVSKAASILGIVIGNTPSGIVFDYNYALAGIGSLTWHSWLNPVGITNVRFQ